MPKFTLIAEHINDNDNTVSSRVTHEFNEDYLYDVVMMMQEFLRGVGFYFDGELCIAEEKSKHCSHEDSIEVEHHECFWDTERNR